MFESLDRWSAARRRSMAGALLLGATLVWPAAAGAQSPNQGAVTFRGGVDAPTVYVLRGLVQERDPSLTLTPWADVGFTLKSSDGVRRIGVDLGVWNSLNTGSAGSKGFTERLHYAETFNASLALGISRRVALATTYTAFTSPNLMFDTVKEVSVTVTHADRFRPYLRVASEVGDRGMDGGVRKGTYAELGATPTLLSRRRAILAVPVRVGLSASNYYELDGADHAFGFLSIGGLVSVPVTSASSALGAWSLRGGVDYYTFGDTTKAFNRGEAHKVVGLVGVGVSY